jgi:hypothetical protein
MPNYSPLVKANVINIKTDRPQKDDRFLLDTNVLYWVTYHRSDLTDRAPSSVQATQYPAYVKSALQANSTLYWSSLSIAELTTLIERSEYDIFCKNNQISEKFSLKDYRHGYPKERIDQVLPEIKAAWNSVQGIGKCIDSLVTQDTISQSILDFNNQSVDGYDSLILNALQTSNITQIITDDIDFITVPGVTIFTANFKALSAAKSQNKLIDRSNLGKAIQRPQRK